MGCPTIKIAILHILRRNLASANQHKSLSLSGDGQNQNRLPRPRWHWRKTSRHTTRNPSVGCSWISDGSTSARNRKTQEVWCCSWPRTIFSYLERRRKCLIPKLEPHTWWYVRRSSDAYAGTPSSDKQVPPAGSARLEISSRSFRNTPCRCSKIPDTHAPDTRPRVEEQARSHQGFHNPAKNHLKSLHRRLQERWPSPSLACLFLETLRSGEKRWAVESFRK